MWEIWANKFLPKALRSCPKSNKSPNLATLLPILIWPKLGFFWQVEFFSDSSINNFAAVVGSSVTRLGNLLDFGQLFKAFGSN